MFSEPFISNKVLEKYTIKLDGEKLDLNDSKNNIYPIFLYQNIKIYKELRDPNHEDIILNTINKRFKNKTSQTTLNRLIKTIWNNEDAVKKFPKWLSCFIANRTGKKFHLLEVSVEYYSYNNKKYKLLRTESILKK